MKKVLVTIFFVLILVPALILCAGYAIMSAHYDKTFMFGIFVNDVYVSGMTPEQVNEKLLEQMDTGTLTIVPKDSEAIELPLSDIGYQNSFLEELRKLQAEDNPVKWAMRMLSQSGNFTEYEIEASATYDEEALSSFMQQHKELNDCSGQTDLKVEIKKTEDGYTLRDDTLTLLDGQKAKEVIESAIEKEKESVDLEKEDCYIQKKYTREMEETLALWKQVDRLQSSRITYIFGENTEVLDASVMADWIKLDEDGNFFFNEDGKLEYDTEKVKAYVKELADQYDTTNKIRTFHTTSGRNVTIKNTNYGDKIDQKAEVEYLLTYAPKGVKEEHIPTYSQRAFASGENDIGDTYIEVDIAEQMMYYYQSGRIVLETPVVTGNTSLGRGTPEKICYVYFKQRNRVLRGEDYETPVSYWIAVNGAIGIHDATWRGKFGGTIYKTNGSHGCINTPTKAVSQLYDMVEIGTPVIIFY